MDGSLDLRTRQNQARKVSELDLLDLRREGTKHFHQKRFKEALKCFNKAIELDVKPPASLLNHRAATFIELQMLQPALLDAKKILEQDRTNINGYLRAGQILLIMKQSSLALEIYELGLRRVGPRDKGAKRLKEVRDDLTKRLSPTKALDPLQTVPLEITQLIINYLSFQEKVRLLRVSKSWHALLTAMPGLWAKLELESASRSLSTTTMRKYVRYANNNCVSLHFGRFQRDQQSLSTYVALRCLKLQELKMTNGVLGYDSMGAFFCKNAAWGQSLRTLCISEAAQISPDLIVRFLEMCPSLERAEFYGVTGNFTEELNPLILPNLRTLLMNGPRYIRDPHTLKRINAFLAVIQRVTSLTLKFWSFDSPDFSLLQGLEHLDISGSTLGGRVRPNLPESLQSLRLNGLKHHSSISGPNQPANLSRLSILSAGDTGLYTPISNLMQLLTPNKGGLREADLSGLYTTSASDIKALIEEGFLAGVERLALRNCPVDDDMATFLAFSLPCLKALNLACTSVTGVGVKILVTTLRERLEWLGLNECSKTHPDAVEWARSVGVRVSYRFLSSSRNRDGSYREQG